MNESALHILVVDDDMMARMTAGQCVKQAGHTAAMAEGGVRAIEMLHSDKYDLVLLDLMMPDMDGFEVLRQIKENPQLKDLPVIMVSGADEAESIAKCIQMGAAAHLAKPLDSMRLTNLIAECMAKLTPT
ncbi:MAG: response regulator [bacterium]